MCRRVFVVADEVCKSLKSLSAEKKFVGLEDLRLLLNTVFDDYIEDC